MVRAPFTDHNGIRKGAWSKEEDDILRAYVLRYGHWNWRALPKYAGLSRCGKSCRLRWINYLRPGVKHGNYTEQEEHLIIELHEQYGNKWSKISAKLPGRTDNEIKNHWHTHLKKRTKQSASSSGFQEKHSSRKQSSEIRDLKVADIDPSVPILESSSLSPEPSSFSSEFSQLNCDSAMVAESSSTSTSSDWNIREDIFTSFQTSEISSEDFWTQPFVPEQDAYTLPNLPIEDGLMSAYFSSYQDSIDLFYQIMPELPAN